MICLSTRGGISLKNKSIGFIGLGNIGALMAKNLLKAGNILNVYDVNPQSVESFSELGANACTSPKEVGEKSDIVFLSLPNSSIVERVITGENGVQEGLTSGGTIVDLSSSEPSSTKKIHEILSQKGIIMFDAPVAGGTEGAAVGQLSIRVGGEENKLNHILPFLNVIGDKVIHVGSIGSGHALKAINNLLYATILVASCEAVTLGVKAGIDANKILEVLSVSSGRNFVVDVKFKSIILTRDFSPRFTTNLLLKDMDIALSLAKEQGVSLVLNESAQQIITKGQQQGLGELDHTAIIKLYEEPAGVVVK
jgi:3-hydroxyisobutyrate dehydrogenase-like beta-hydroxyacid dehydrogenase